MLRYQLVPVTAFAQNCSIVWDDESMEAVLIDAGGEPGKLKQMVNELGVKVIALWNTHAHCDHIGGVGHLATHFQIPVIGPQQDDQFLVDELIECCIQYRFPIPEPVQVTQWLHDGDKVYLGKHEFQVFHTPGHTPGHVVFYCAEIDTVWVGDVLFKGSIGRTDFPRGNYEHLIQAIQTKLLILPPHTKVISGHGPTTTIGEEIRNNPFIKKKPLY